MPRCALPPGRRFEQGLQPLPRKSVHYGPHAPDGVINEAGVLQPMSPLLTHRTLSAKQTPFAGADFTAKMPVVVQGTA
jgi:hypothetical protein